MGHNLFLPLRSERGHLSTHFKFLSSSKFHMLKFYRSQNLISIKYRPQLVLTSEVGAWSTFKPSFRSLQIFIYLKICISAPDHQNFLSISKFYMLKFYLAQNFISIQYRPQLVLTSQVGAWSTFKPLQISILLKILYARILSTSKFYIYKI